MKNGKKVNVGAFCVGGTSFTYYLVVSSLVNNFTSLTLSMNNSLSLPTQNFDCKRSRRIKKKKKKIKKKFGNEMMMRKGEDGVVLCDRPKLFLLLLLEVLFFH